MNAFIFENLSNENYHADKEHISRSGLMEFKKSPFHYWNKYINPEARTEEMTPSLIFGSAFHALILEYDTFYKKFDFLPEIGLLKEIGREQYDFLKHKRYQILHSGKLLLSESSFQELWCMKKALESHSDAWSLIEGGLYEHSLFWKDEESELLLKARPDILHNNMIVDLKTCNDASPQAFQRAMTEHGYHIQGAMIREGWKILTGEDIPNVINICIEKTYPYAIGIYIIDEAALEAGTLEFKRLAIDLKHAMVHNKWDSYSIQTVGLPKWYL